jgi:hypothetical protein
MAAGLCTRGAAKKVGLSKLGLNGRRRSLLCT